MKKGELFIVTTGEYSDYGIAAKFEALQQFSADAELAQWVKDHPESSEKYHFNSTKFLQWLETRGLVKEATIREWHLESYSSLADGSPAGDSEDV